MFKYNAFYAQSGGATAVINASACGVIETAKRFNTKIGKVYAGQNGILGALQEALIDTQLLSEVELEALRYTPGAAFGSCRYKLGDVKNKAAEYERILAVFQAHNIRYFFYNGGGDSQDTAYKLSVYSQQQHYPLVCIGIPKTIDNDLAYTDSCPGFGSVAKYVAISILEAGLDIRSMCHSSTQVFILEVMGRHSGWIAAAAGLAARQTGDSPHLILFPEIPFSSEVFLGKVADTVKKFGFCTIVASEGIRDNQGKFLATTGKQDAFNHQQLGGVAPHLAHSVTAALGLKNHWAVSDYLQRAARHIASQTDIDQAYALGQAAVEFAIQGKSNVMPILVRRSTATYQWTIGEAPLAQVANQERLLPRSFITSDGFHITDACREYLLPLIQGEAYPVYRHGLPDYWMSRPKPIPCQLAPFILP